MTEHEYAAEVRKYAAGRFEVDENSLVLMVSQKDGFSPQNTAEYLAGRGKQLADDLHSRWSAK